MPKFAHVEIESGFEQPLFLEIGDARVCYRRAGNGHALLLFPGYPLSGRTWRKVIPDLATRFDCYAFDLVGLGDSTSRNPEDFTSPGQGRVFQAARAALGLSSYSIIGNNSGGWVARELALLEPGLVRHLVLTNTEIPRHRPPWVGFYQRLAALPGSLSVFQKLLASRTWRDSRMGFGGCFQNFGLIEGEFCEAFLAPLLGSRERLARALQFLRAMNFKRIDEFEELHRTLTMPVSFVWGADDPTFPESQAREMSRQFPNVAGFTAIPGAKLFLHEEFPEQVCKALRTSLETSRSL